MINENDKPERRATLSSKVPALVRALLVMSVLVVVLGVFLWPAVRDARESARQSHCKGNLYKLGLALRQYHSNEGSFPPAFALDPNGNRLFSWRVPVLTYLENSVFYERYNLEKAWDQPDNLKLTNELQFRGFTCPSGRSKNPRSSDFVPGDSMFTDYVAVVGPGTVFPGNGSISASQIRDGPENTILLVEIAKSKIHWSEPKDLRIDQMSFTLNHPTLPSISSPHAAGPCVVFADGRYYRMSESIPPAFLKALLTINGGEKISRKDLDELGFLNPSEEARHDRQPAIGGE